MSLTSGFFNSLNHDRQYYASDFARLFDGIINDGVYQNIGTALVATASSGLTVNVGIGLAWVKHTWTYNDAILGVTADESDLLLDRIDALVLEVNTEQDTRANTIKFVNGVASSSPEKPTLTNTDTIIQKPIAYVTRAARSTEITAGNIENCIGTTEFPFVSGVMDTIDLDTVLPQWRAELDEYVAAGKKQLQSDYDDLEKWTENQKQTVLDWFDSLKDTISADAAVKLQTQITDNEIEHWLTVGLSDGVKSFSDDGTVISTTDSAGRKLVKTFSDSFSTCTTILYDSNGGELGQMVKKFSSDGKTISTTMTIV